MCDCIMLDDNGVPFDVSEKGAQVILALRAKLAKMNKVGTQEGDVCNRNGCQGEMGYRPTENCSCHINPPCNQCTDNPLICLECNEEVTVE